MLITNQMMNIAQSMQRAYSSPFAIIRVAWLAFVTITITPSPITPMIRGIFPENTFRGKVCLLQDLKSGDENAKGEIYKKDFLARFFLVIQIFYASRFLYRMTRYINGQCPAGKMCSIGKYQRNVLGLESTFWAGLSGSCFMLLQNIVRIVTEQNLNRWDAFYANFILLDSLIYLFYISIFSFACSLKDIPSVSDTPRKVVFYVSRPREWEPRRPKQQFEGSASLQVQASSSSQIVRRERFKVPMMMQKTVDSSFGAVQHFVTIHQSPNPCHQNQNRGHQDKKPNVRIPKLTHIKEYASADRQLTKTSKHRFSYFTKN